MVAGSVATGSALALAGIVGSPNYPERFDAKQIVVVPDGTDGVRITEHVDQDFGSQKRHGYERVIPTDFGVPTDIEARSPDAPDQLNVTRLLQTVRIRIGDPGKTVTGQHRYTLAYTLPDAQLSTGTLALDIIASGEVLETGRMEVIVAGMTLEDTQCSVGWFGASGGCELVPDTIDGVGVYRVVFEPLRAGYGVTIGGRIVSRTVAPTFTDPPIPARRNDHRGLIAAAVAAVGALTGFGMFRWARRRGRNEVAGGGAADAAYADGRPRPAIVPPPPPTAPSGPASTPMGAPPGTFAPPGAQPGGVLADASTRLVTDAELAQMATIEFVPPRGLQPWEGQALLAERVGDETISAWFSGHAARDVLTIYTSDGTPGGGTTRVAPGPRYDEANAVDRPVLDAMFAGRESFALGSYDPKFAGAWTQARTLIRRSLQQSRFWRSSIPGTGASASMPLVPMLTFIVFAGLTGFGSLIVSLAGTLHGVLGGVLFALVVPGVVALMMYRRLLPSRTALGSALALRTESFRRFLASSEGSHVEWAWKNGLLREYSAWAVALGAADAWRHAMEASGVPRTEFDSGPMLLYTHRAALTQSYIRPSSSGGGGGGSFGGFSGGSVGGGGGGGSSGSW